MSTSDAGELELRAVAERATPHSRTALSGRSAAARAQEETRGDRFLQEKHGYENITDQDHQLPAVSQEGAHRALIFGADVVRPEKAAHCAGSEIQIQKPSGPRLASSLFLTLSQNRRFDKQDQKLRLTPDPHPQSLTEPQKAETEDSCGQFIRRTSPPETDSNCLLPEATPSPASKEEEVITVVCNELETNKDLSGRQHLSHSDCGPHEHNGLHILPCEAQPKRTGSGSIELEDDIKW
ncbi:uncharacterized protein [Trachinotus anak]|uniref:uncharacterized protein isoform X2 n=1 Tax=Trachinotus anak TaxID=443729 RepID=UPI0039F1A992